MQIQEPSGTNLIQIKVSGVDKFLATDIANSVSEAFAHIYSARSSSQRSQTKAFLEKKVVDLKLKLEESVQKLLQERRALSLTGDGDDFTNQTIALFSNRLVDAKTNLENAKLAWSKIENYVVVDDQRTYSSQSLVEIEEAVIGNQDTRYVGSVVEELPILWFSVIRDSCRKQSESWQRMVSVHICPVIF